MQGMSGNLTDEGTVGFCAPGFVGILLCPPSLAAPCRTSVLCADKKRLWFAPKVFDSTSDTKAGAAVLSVEIGCKKNAASPLIPGHALHEEGVQPEGVGSLASSNARKGASRPAHQPG